MSARTGIVRGVVAEDRKRGVLVEIGCATEVVERKPAFDRLALDVATKLLASAPSAEVEALCRMVGRELGETIRVRRKEHITADANELLAVHGTRGFAVVVAAQSNDVALVDAAAHAIVARKRTPNWRARFGAIPRPVDWRDATVMLMACEDPELSRTLPRDDGGYLIDRPRLRGLHERLLQRSGFALTQCVIFDLAEDDRDPEPTGHEDAIAVRAAG